MLRKQLEQPLIDKPEIEKRLDAVAELLDNAICREELREYLTPGLRPGTPPHKDYIQISQPRGSDSFSQLPFHAGPISAASWEI